MASSALLYPASVRRLLLLIGIAGCAQAPAPAVTPTPPPVAEPAPPRAGPVAPSSSSGSLLREAPGTAPPRNTYQLDLVDLDGDGRPELIRANTQQPVEILRWKGGWQVVAELPGLGPHQGVAAADLDGDGRPELAVAVAGGASRVHRNAPGWPVLWAGAEDSVFKDVAAADRTGAGVRAFLFVGPSGLAEVGPGGLRTVEDPGAGSEIDAVAVWPGEPGQPDLLHVAVSGRAPAPDFVLRGLIREPVEAAAARQPTADAAWGTTAGGLRLALANPDGPDAVLGEAGALVWSHPRSVHRREAAWGDLDGDGSDDLVLAGEGGAEAWSFAAEPALIWSVQDEHLREGLAVGDVDGDGRVDVVLGGRDAELEPTLAPGAPGGLGLRTFLGQP